MSMLTSAKLLKVFVLQTIYEEYFLKKSKNTGR